MSRVYTRASLAQRFWRYVEPGEPDECWEWTASRTDYGYGRIGADPRNGERARRAHRVSWELHHGSIPAGMYVLHRCDNPPCVNPAHLFLGTLRDNVVDAVDKGRMTRWTPRYGTDHGKAVLTAAMVRTIRAEVGRGISRASLARRFRVSVSTVSRAASGRTYSNV